jgi:polyisoprenoid-binding protein YceI
MRALLLLGVLLSAATYAAKPTVPAPVPLYAVQPGSALQFQGTQQGERFTGRVMQFDARITFDATRLPESNFDVTMQLKSLDSRNAERDQAMQTTDWFDVSRYPTATFRTVAFRSTPQGPVADADLTIKGRTKRIVFPFQWQPNGSLATLDARVTLDRLDFGLGAGEWADDSVVGRRVEVLVHLQLNKTAPPTISPAPKKK